jgi:hypothetical protein
VKRLALVAALIGGCQYATDHPYKTTIAIANGALVTGASVCAIECGGDPRTASDAVLITEGAIIGAAVLGIIIIFAAYAGTVVK